MVQIVGIEQAPFAEPDLESKAAAANDPTRERLNMRSTEMAQSIKKDDFRLAMRSIVVPNDTHLSEIGHPANSSLAKSGGISTAQVM